MKQVLAFLLVFGSGGIFFVHLVAMYGKAPEGSPLALGLSFANALYWGSKFAEYSRNL